MDSAVDSLIELLRQNRAGRPAGIYSVCSSHPYALRAALIQARTDNTIALVESTSNQVNQTGGYTDMTPRDFVSMVSGIATAVGLPRERIAFGGDHLGPHPWRELPAAECLPMADAMVRAYVAAGFEKIHLDVSMYLGDDEKRAGSPLPPEIAAVRTADLCLAAEDEWARTPPTPRPPLYIVGNEVPVPGGTSIEDGELVPSSPAEVRESLAAMESEFVKRGLADAWQRVIGVVVQPGVEFGDDVIHEYKRAGALVSLLDELPGLVYEAHSTDYQRIQALKDLVADHFAILKVGPALTFAFREAVVALEAIEVELYSHRSAPRSALTQTVLQAMMEDPRYWENYYSTDGGQDNPALLFSYSDRIRYYWTLESVQVAFDRLVDNLASRVIPQALLSQYLPREYAAVREGALGSDPPSLILHHVMAVTETYSRACGPRA